MISEELQACKRMKPLNHTERQLHQGPEVTTIRHQCIFHLPQIKINPNHAPHRYHTGCQLQAGIIDQKKNRQ